MFKTLINLTKAAKDITVIASKETAYQLGKANDTSADATGKLANKAATMRQQYEQKLKARKALDNDPTKKIIHMLPQEQDS
jgi:hypothetical protein